MRRFHVYENRTAGSGSPCCKLGPSGARLGRFDFSSLRANAYAALTLQKPYAGLRSPANMATQAREYKTSLHRVDTAKKDATQLRQALCDCFGGAASKGAVSVLAPALAAMHLRAVLFAPFCTVQWLSNGTRGALHRTFAVISVLLSASSNLLCWVSSGTKPLEFDAETDPAKLPNI